MQRQFSEELENTLVKPSVKKIYGEFKDLVVWKYYRNIGRNKTMNDHIENAKESLELSESSPRSLCVIQGKTDKNWILNFKKDKL